MSPGPVPQPPHPRPQVLACSSGSMHPLVPESPHQVICSQRCLRLAGWGFWHKVQCAPERARPSHSSLFLSTGFLRGISMGVLASLYLESFSLCHLFPTQSIWNIFIYIYFFPNPKSFASHNHLPGCRCPGPALHFTSLCAPSAAFCLGWGEFPERPEDDPPSLCSFNADTQVALL